MERIISVSNQKGGVGKTTTSVNLAACLAEIGKKVLLVDIDPQGNASRALGVDKNELNNTIYELLLDECSVENALIAEIFENLDIIPSNINLAGAEIELFETKKSNFILKEKLMSIQDNYDFIIVDCPPSLNILTLNAWTYSDTVLVPLQCEFFALEGLTQLMQTVKLVKKQLNTKLEIEGVVFTMFDARTKLSVQVVEEVKNELINTNIYQTIIPRNVRLGEAPSYGLPINKYSPRSKGAKSYKELAKEVLERREY